MTENPPFCFMRVKHRTCVKNQVDPKYKSDYQCEQCLWRIHNSDPTAMARMEKLFLRMQQQK